MPSRQPRSRPSLVCTLAALLLLGAFASPPANAKAISSAFGPNQHDAGFESMPMAAGEYLRDTYPYVGVAITIETYRSSTWTANPDDGDTWSIEIRNQETGRTLGAFSMSYDAASDCLM